MQAEATINGEEVSRGLSIIDDIDPTGGIDISEESKVNVRATRWLFAAGNTMTRERMKQTGFAFGGSEVANRCLRRTAWGNGNYIPRLTFTPLEPWYEAIPPEFTCGPDAPAGFNNTVPIRNPHNVIPAGMEAYYKHQLSLVGQVILPGHQVTILTDAAKNRICEVELTALAGVEYSDGKAQVFDRLFWPDEFKKQALHGEISLSSIRDRIEQVCAVAIERTHPELQTILSLANDMRLSCDLFESWANEKIGENHTQLRQRMTHQHTYRYAPFVLETLLPQMGVNREDTAFQPNKAPVETVTAGDLANILAERDAIADKRQADFQASILELVGVLSKNQGGQRK